MTLVEEMEKRVKDKILVFKLKLETREKDFAQRAKEVEQRLQASGTTSWYNYRNDERRNLISAISYGSMPHISTGSMVTIGYNNSRFPSQY